MFQLLQLFKIYIILLLLKVIETIPYWKVENIFILELEYSSKIFYCFTEMFQFLKQNFIRILKRVKQI